MFTAALFALIAQAPFQPSLKIHPSDVHLHCGASITFSAEMNYPPGVNYLRQPVKWVVVEKEGGTITPNGLYKAPVIPGKFHVKVTRTDAQLSATAKVVVE